MSDASKKLSPYVHSDGKEWDHFFVAHGANGSVLWYRRRYLGREIKFSTKIGPEKAVSARRFANEEFERRIGKRKANFTPLIGEELKLWEKIKEGEGLKYDTLNNVKRAVRQVGEFWGDKLPIDMLDPDIREEWYADFAYKHPGITMENAVKYIRVFCGHLAEKVVHGRAILPTVPTFRIPNQKKIEINRSRKKERVLTHDELLTIIRTAPGWTESLVVLFMYTMATRIDETLKLDFARTILMDEDPPVYRWFKDQNKAGLKNEHALNTVLIEPLRKLREQRKLEGTTLLFPQKYNNQQALREQQIDWDGWRQRANLGWHWTPHTFRHTCLTNLFADEKNPQALIIKLYRVSLVVALKHYIKVTKSSILKMQNVIEVRL